MSYRYILHRSPSIETLTCTYYNITRKATLCEKALRAIMLSDDLINEKSMILHDKKWELVTHRPSFLPLIQASSACMN